MDLLKFIMAIVAMCCIVILCVAAMALCLGFVAKLVVVFFTTAYNIWP